MQKSTKQVIVLAVVALIAAAALVAVVVKPRFGGGGATASGPTTAIGSLSAAASALATSAPDARLLVVQMLSSAPTTGTPAWAYLFGSPSTGQTYLVYAAEGQVMTASEYGPSGMPAEEWANVPDVDSWEIDSDEAYAAAVEVSGATGDPAGYFMGMITYKSPDDTSTVEPFQWNVWLDPGASGATTNLIIVDAKTGKATVTQ